MILQDYDKGLFDRTFAARLIGEARAAGVFVSADPKSDLLRFRGVDLLKPNLAEARALVPCDASTQAGRRALLEKVRHEVGVDEVVVTRGAEGMTALDLEGRVTDHGTRPAEVFDVQGAGDTAIAVLTLCRAAGAPLVEACIVANAAAAVVVGKRGTAAIDPEELRTSVARVGIAFEETS